MCSVCVIFSVLRTMRFNVALCYIACIIFHAVPMPFSHEMYVAYLMLGMFIKHTLFREIAHGYKHCCYYCIISSLCCVL